MNGAPQTLIEAIGWTLVHVIWQGTLAAAAVTLFWAGLPRAKPQLRYAIACAGLLAIALAGLATFVIEVRQHVEQGGDAISRVDLAATASEQRAGAAAASVEPSPASARETPAAAAADGPSAIGQGTGQFLAALRPWLPAIVALWGLGVSVLSARLALQWWSIRRVSSGRRPIDDPTLVTRLRDLAGTLGIGQPVGLFSCARTSVPFVLGWLRPAILLPVGLLSGLNAAELEAIIAHELAHIRRHDYLVNLLQTLVETIYFYHPAVWWLSRLARQEREFCCDEMAAAACGDRVGYGRALLALEHWCGAPERLLVAANGGSFVERVRRLAGTAPRRYRPGAVVLASIALLGILVAIVAVAGRAGPTDEASKFTVTTVEQKAVTLTQPYVAHINSQRHIKIRALEKGYLESINVKEGQHVKAGDALFQVIPILYQKKVEAEQAEANLAELDLKGAKKLFENKMVSQEEVARFEAKLSKAQANADLAKAELDFATVKAPFDGIIGRPQHQQGSLVLEGEVLTTLSDNSVMWVYFNVPEARYLEYMQDQRKEEVKIELLLASGTKFGQAGKLGAIDADFNNNTANIPFRADFPNPDGLLRHGQHGTILVSRVANDALVIPQRATFEVLNKRYVFVIDKNNVAHQHEIVIQNELDDIFVVKAGVGVGDKILVDGIRLIQDGDKVKYEER